MVGERLEENRLGFYLSAANIRKAICFVPRLATSPFRVLPDFMVAGFPKCGTTSLYNLIIKHPCVRSAFQKETAFFTRSSRKGMLWYRAFFPTVFEKRLAEMRGNTLITGEASPGYAYFPKILERIYAMNPKIRLITIMRDPVERAYSNYMHLVRRGYGKSMEEAIKDDLQGMEGRAPRFNILSGGIYHAALGNIFSVFPRGQVLCLKAEDFFKNPKEITNECFRFLGLTEHELEEYAILNKGGHGGGMDESVRSSLEEFYKPHNAKLYELLGRDFGW